MMNTIIFVLCLVLRSANSAVHGIEITPEEDLVLERKLKIINKPPIKVIHTEYGYIVDCIDINKQPAFDHPLLKNHTLQRKPSFHVPIEETHDSPIFGLDKDECPTGTVPIRRTTKEDLIREKSLNYSIMNDGGIIGLHRAEVALSSQLGPYYAVHGWNSIYNPKVVGAYQASIAHIWVQNGRGNKFNVISFGWHVDPQVNGDYATHLYAAWTSDNFQKTGCFNIRCSGFVQTHLKGVLGSRLKNISSYDGPVYNFNSTIIQDPETKNWWLIVAGMHIGYFPAAIFSNLRGAEQVGWGGRTLTPRRTSSPPMGSGYFPDRNFFHASFFKMISYQNETRISHGPENYLIQYFADKRSCFGLSYYGNLGGFDGYSLQFGGPGGNCGD